MDIREPGEADRARGVVRVNALSTAVQVLGVVVACVGAFLIDVGLGIAIVGGAVFLFGLALERGE